MTCHVTVSDAQRYMYSLYHLAVNHPHLCVSLHHLAVSDPHLYVSRGGSSEHAAQSPLHLRGEQWWTPGASGPPQALDGLHPTR